MFDEKALTEKLIAMGNAELEKAKTQTTSFGVPPEVSVWITDLENYPHLFLLACIADRQVKAEKAWSIPYNMHLLFGDVSFEALEKLKTRDWLAVTKKAGHRFQKTIADALELGIKRIRTQYDGDAANIWNDKPSSAELIQRLREFDGVGQKIAAMTAQILVRDFGIEYTDYKRLDIAVDVHTRRVMKRLGLVDSKDTDQEIIFKARQMNPDFPGVFDLPLWKVGRNFCFETSPNCNKCLLNRSCLKKIKASTPEPGHYRT